MVRLVGVCKSYPGGGDVLAGVDLELSPGRPVVVVGANGSGKSTLLRIAAGASAPSAGSVTGRPPVVGFLPGRVPASLRMPVVAYLRHLAALHGVPRAVARAHELLDELGFSGDATAPMAQLSSGNVAKVGLAQALSCDAGLVVLDEPWAALDARAAAALDRRLRAEAERTTLLVADHTGRGPALPGALVLRLADGRLTLEIADLVSDDGDTLVELRCPGDPAAALRVLPPVRESWTGPGSLTVRVPVARGDAVLAAALGHGCSVLGVWRE